MSEVFGKYKLIKQLGEGAKSFLYLVQAPHLDVPVALKVFKNSSDALETDLNNFKAEANLLHQLRGQPNIVSLMDADQLSDGRCFIVMPYYASNLSHTLANVNNLSVSMFVSLIEQTLTGLAVLHSKGFIHRDLKPANLLLDEHSRVFIADFGIAQSNSRQLAEQKRQGKHFGTPEYLSPELLNDQHSTASPSSDIYSLGVVFSKLYKITSIEDADFDEAIKDFIAHCLSPDSQTRLQDASLALDTFQCLLKTFRWEEKNRSEEFTQEVDHAEHLSQSATVVMQMIRGVLINKGSISKKDRKILLASFEFQQLLNEQSASNFEREKASVETLLDEIIQKVTQNLNLSHPNWRELANTTHKKHASPKMTMDGLKRRRLKILIWTFTSLCIATVLMLAGNKLVKSFNQDAQGLMEKWLSQPKASLSERKVEPEPIDKSSDERNVNEVFYSQINISTFPKNADVLLFNANSEVVPLNNQRSAFLTYGNYKIRISKNGFTTLNQELVLNQDQHNFEFSLDVGDSRYFIGSSDIATSDGVPIEFILLPQTASQAIRIRMMSHEVTNQLYQLCVMQNACRALKKLSTDPRQAIFENPQHPVVNLSWFDINERFIPWLSQHTQSVLRLPGELEWQEAASAGAKTRFSWGDSMRRGYAHCRDCNAMNNRHTMPVRQYPPNAWSLFDMLGNVQEWTSDCWQASEQTPIRCDQAVVKGGSWLDGKNALQLNARSYLNKTARSHSTGFRLVEEVNTKVASYEE